MKTLGRGAINVVEADIRYVERYVGDVSAVRNPMHGASANVHGGFGRLQRVNLGEVVARSSILL